MAGGMTVKLVDNSQQVKGQMQQNVYRALVAVGTEGVGCVKSTMEAQHIRKTGNLIGSITYQPEATGTGGKVRIGTSVKYAIFVHEGHVVKPGLHFIGSDGKWHTTKGGHVAGRPFLRDGILKNLNKLQEVFATYLKEGF